MILSFHPCFEADANIICAGRQPNSKDLKKIKASRAVILPQGCREPLYKMATDNCPHVFPDYRAKFEFPGKSGQIRLFKKTGVPSPITKIFKYVSSYKNQYPDVSALPGEFPFPFVVTYNAEDIDQKNTYAVSIRITDSDGNLIYINTSAYNVITGGNSSQVDVMVEAV